MRVIDALRRKKAEDGPVYDPVAQRTEVAETMAGLLNKCSDHIAGRVAPSVDGPLGGQSSRFVVTCATPVGARSFIVNVYANGVFSKAQMERYGG